VVVDSQLARLTLHLKPLRIHPPFLSRQEQVVLLLVLLQLAVAHGMGQLQVLDFLVVAAL